MKDGAVQCRSCGGEDGEIVLNLGDQPASDHFPLQGDSGPDPVYPLQMWLCSSCSLAQLLADATVPEEPLATEPAALTQQAASAVTVLASTGWLRSGMQVLEYGSPHGGSWLPLLSERGITAGNGEERADVVLDCFGLMHEADQLTALESRAARVAPGGALLLQFHSLATILQLGQWNALRHGHYAYYSTTALCGMLASIGFTPLAAWTFDLYGGTVLLAAVRAGTLPQRQTDTVTALLADESEMKIGNADAFRELNRAVGQDARSVTDWLIAQRESGRRVMGYGAASRAVALLCKARVDQHLLPAIADASPGKHGRRMPGTNIPVVPPAELATSNPQAVLLMLPDLMNEVRAAHPEVEASGGQWISVEELR